MSNLLWSQNLTQKQKGESGKQPGEDVM